MCKFSPKQVRVLVVFCGSLLAMSGHCLTATQTDPSKVKISILGAAGAGAASAGAAASVGFGGMFDFQFTRVTLTLNSSSGTTASTQNDVAKSILLPNLGAPSVVFGVEWLPWQSSAANDSRRGFVLNGSAGFLDWKASVSKLDPDGKPIVVDGKPQTESKTKGATNLSAYLGYQYQFFSFWDDAKTNMFRLTASFGPTMRIVNGDVANDTAFRKVALGDDRTAFIGFQSQADLILNKVRGRVVLSWLNGNVDKLSNVQLLVTVDALSDIFRVEP